EAAGEAPPRHGTPARPPFESGGTSLEAVRDDHRAGLRRECDAAKVGIAMVVQRERHVGGGIDLRAVAQLGYVRDLRLECLVRDQDGRERIAVDARGRTDGPRERAPQDMIADEAPREARVRQPLDAGIRIALALEAEGELQVL